MRLCIVKRCIVRHCIVRHCIARYYIAKHCSEAWNYKALYLETLHHKTLDRCIAKHWNVVSWDIISQDIVSLNHKALYPETLHHKTHLTSLRFCITSYCKILRITRCCIKKRLHCETFDVNSLRNDINDILVRTYIVYACIEVELDRDSIVNEPFAIRLFSLMQCNSAVRDD